MVAFCQGGISMDVKDKKVLVVGSGLSGIAAVGLLEEVGAYPYLYDSNEKTSIEDVKKKLPSNSQAQVVIGELPKEIEKNMDLLVLSPGVPTDLPIFDSFKKKGIPIWGEIELAYVNAKGRILAITGTNGKTTTTSLLGEIVRHYQENTFVVGNIGTPYSRIARNTTEDSFVVAEMSSFQLETIHSFKPVVSAILNITPDHLDRHHTMEEYIRVKERITLNQGAEDTCVLNYEDEILREFSQTLHTKVLFFSSQRKLKRGIYLEEGGIWISNGEERSKIIEINQLKLLGVHNYENVMAAIGMAYSAGIPMKDIVAATKAFKGVEHRIEFVDEKQGVAYYNDSKATNPDAAIKGIQAMNRPTYLIAGGYDKQGDYTKWIQSFDGKVKALVLLGATKEKIAETAKACGFNQITYADTLEEAVSICAKQAKPEEAVLLSPACASWGMFKNYEVRGECFKECVKKI